MSKTQHQDVTEMTMKDIKQSIIYRYQHLYSMDT